MDWGRNIWDDMQTLLEKPKLKLKPVTYLHCINQHNPIYLFFLKSFKLH